MTYDDDDDDDIPPLRRPGDTRPLRTQHDLYQHWRSLMGRLGFSHPSLWILFIAADRKVTSILTQIEDLAACPDAELLVHLMRLSGRLLRSDVFGGSVAFLVSRPGPAQVTESDRAWACGLIEAAADADVRIEPVHLANNEDLRVFAPDDLINSAWRR
ncbi:MAG: hypothetical protein ACR2KG_03315 [Nocardioidaceae bacterium]